MSQKRHGSQSKNSRTAAENFSTEDGKKKEKNAANAEEEQKNEAPPGDEKPESTEEETIEEETAASEEEAKEASEDAGSEEPAAEEEKEEPEKSSGKASKEQAVIEDLNDRLKRQMAEFENFRKRTDKEKSEMFDAGSRSILEKILPVLDNFERGLDQAPEGDPFAEGMDKIYRQFTKTLTDIGLEQIEALGKEFDPNVHNAVMHVDDENAGDNEIVEELQKGYTFHGTVVRHSMVKVAN